MKPQTILFFIILLISSHACLLKKYKPDDLPKTYLSYGNGGGFMGAYKEYVLLKNGQLFRRTDIDAPLENYAQISPSDAKTVFKALDDIDFSEVNLNSPGNIYQFMEYNNNGKRYRIVWGDNNKEVDQQLNQIYREAMRLARPQEGR